jgi:hypothetical protein
LQFSPLNIVQLGHSHLKASVHKIHAHFPNIPVVGRASFDHSDPKKHTSY